MKALLEKMVQDKKQVTGGIDQTKRPREDAPNMAPTSVSDNQGGMGAPPKLAASLPTHRRLRMVAHASITKVASSSDASEASTEGAPEVGDANEDSPIPHTAKPSTSTFKD